MFFKYYLKLFWEKCNRLRQLDASSVRESSAMEEYVIKALFASAKLLLHSDDQWGSPLHFERLIEFSNEYKDWTTSDKFGTNLWCTPETTAEFNWIAIN